MKYKVFFDDIYIGKIFYKLKNEDNFIIWDYKQKSVFGEIEINALLDIMNFSILHLKYIYSKGFQKFNCNIELKSKKKYYEYSVNGEKLITYKPIIIREMLFLCRNIQGIEDNFIYDIENTSFELINMKKSPNKIVILSPIYYVITFDNYLNVKTITDMCTKLKIDIEH